MGREKFTPRIVSCTLLTILVSCWWLSAQVRIQERVEVAKKIRLEAEYSNEDNKEPAIFYDRGVTPGSYVQKMIGVNRCCIVTGSVGVESEEPLQMLILNGLNEDGRKLICYDGINCDQCITIELYPYRYNSWIENLQVEYTIREKDAVVEMNGVLRIWTYKYPFKITFNYHAEPVTSPARIAISSEYRKSDTDGKLRRDTIDATLSSGPVSTGIYVTVLHEGNDRFVLVCKPAPIYIRMNPVLPGVRLSLYDGEETIAEGEAVTASYVGARLGKGQNQNLWLSLQWDGNYFERDTVITEITAEGLGVSGSKKIVLIKSHLHHFTIECERESLYPSETTNFRVVGREINGEELILPKDDMEVTLSTHWGEFIVNGEPSGQEITVPYSVARSGSLRFAAPSELSWWEGGEVTLEVWRADASLIRGSGTLAIKPVCPQLQIVPASIGPGDTASVTIVLPAEIRELYGTQNFILMIISGEEYGWLRSISSGEEGTPVMGGQDFEFIASGTIPSDSLTVELYAFPTDATGGIGASVKDTTGKVERGNVQLLTAKRIETNSEKLPGVRKSVQTMTEKSLVCGIGRVVVANCPEVKFQPCNDNTSIDELTVKVTRDPYCDGASAVTDYPLAGSYIIPTVCSRGEEGLSLMIPEIIGQIEMYLCVGVREGGIIVNTVDDVKDIETAKRALKDFDRQIKELNIVILNIMSGGSRTLTNPDVRCNTAYFLHEKYHATQRYIYFQRALNSAKSVLPKPIPKSIFRCMSEEEINDYFLKHKVTVINAFNEKLGNEKDENEKNEEIKAHKITRDYLIDLVEKIRNKFGLNKY